MNSFDAIDAHVRNAIVGASAGAVLGAGQGVYMSTGLACGCALLMVIVGRKRALTPKKSKPKDIQPRPGL